MKILLILIITTMLFGDKCQYYKTTLSDSKDMLQEAVNDKHTDKVFRYT